MNNLKELVDKARTGDEESICELIRMYTPLIEKYSYLFGKKDEDLQGELLLAFIKCVKNFKLDESALLKELCTEPNPAQTDETDVITDKKIKSSG